MLITAYRERQTRHREKIERLLNFLKEETYSDFKTLMLLFGFRDHKLLYSRLSKVEVMGLIQKHVLVSRTMKISLGGITNDGLAVVLTPDDAFFPARFEPSKITGWTLEHHLDNQAARIILEQKGASGWVNSDRTTVVLQCFQPGSNITFMLNLSDNPQIRHQERASQLGDQLLKSIILTAKLSFHFTVQPAFCPAPVNQLMQSGGVEMGRIGKKTTFR